MSSTYPNNKTGIGADFLCNCKKESSNRKRMTLSFKEIFDLIDQEITWHKENHQGKYLTYEAEENFIKGMVEIRDMFEQVQDRLTKEE